ncbi:MAG: M20 family metallopeptidase [Negativicutes bacterium]|nr:M20 family metallopeptidase [Negativicutes bacterium]
MSLAAAKDQAFAFIDDHRDEMLDLWRELVNQESGSEDQGGVNKLQARLKALLEADGAAVRLLEFPQAGSMLVARIGDGAKPAVIFSGHVDTVFRAGTIASRPFVIRDGKAYGPGVLDMKGGIVAFLYAVKALCAAGFADRPFKILLAGDEETGHPGSNAAEVFRQEAIGSAAAFNCETGFIDDGIVVGRKGVACFKIVTRGVAAHVGNDPENGRSAILEMAHKIIAIEKLTDWTAGTSFNVGVIEGGNVANATPDYAKISVDVRFVADEAIPVLTRQLQEIADRTHVAGTTTTLSGGATFKPMATTAGVMRLFNLVQETCAENGFGRPYARQSGGGADSAYTVLAGVPTVCAMGVKGGRNHSPEEFAVVETLFERAKLLAACVLNLDRL